jgi:heme exporter protein A
VTSARDPLAGDAAIAWSGVRKEFGRTEALRGVDLAVPAGRVLALLGPNGAGKTTLLRIGAGLSRATAGGATVGGVPVGEARARARLGFLGHATFLYGHLTPLENLLFYARLHGLPDGAPRAAALLEEAGVARRAREPVARLSRGTQQRVALCRAFLHDPRVLLLDEPFTGLDPAGVALLTARLRTSAQRGVAAVVATHDLGAALAVADGVAVLGRGRIAAERDATGLAPDDLRRLYETALAGEAA